MPRVTIPGVGDVNFPDNMSRDDIMSRAQAMQAQAQQPIFDPRDLGIGQLIKGGFGRSVEGLKGTALDLIPALGASIIGKKDYAKEQLEEYKARMAAEEEINPTGFKSYKEIRGPGDALGYAAETFGELGPDIAAFLTGAGAGSVVAKKIAQKGLEKAATTEAKKLALTKAGETGAKVGLGASSGAINIPDTLNSIYQDTGEIRPGLAVTVGSLVSALDTYLPAKMLSQLGTAGKERVALEMLKKSKQVPTTWKKAFGTELLTTMGGEGLTESAQEALQIMASQIAGDKNKFFSADNVDRIINSGIKGAIGGGAFGVPGAAIEAKRTVAEQQQAIARQQAEQQQNPLGPPAPIPQQQTEMFGEQPQATPYNAREAQEDLAQQTAPTPVQEVAPQQMGLDLQGGMTAEQQQVEQQNLQNQEMNQLYMEEAAQKQAEAKQRAITAKQMFDQELAATDERVRLGELNRREAARLDLLHPILENMQIEDSTAAFQGNLKRAGYANLELTDVEKSLIARANDVKAALRDSETVQVEPSLPNQLTPDITGIAEKGEKGPAGEPKPVEPEQTKLDLGSYKTPRVKETQPEPEPEAAVAKTILDADTLVGTGLNKASGFFKQLLGKDMANPADQPVVADVLARVRTNKAIAPSTRQAIESIANQAFTALSKQAEMFGPRGGILKEAEAKEPKNVRAKPISTGTRASVPVPNKQVSKDTTERTTRPEQKRVGVSKGSTSRPDDRKESKPAPLKEEKVEAPAPKKASSPATKATPTPKTKAQTNPESAENLKALQDDLAAMEKYYEDVVDPETKAQLGKDIAATKKDIAEGRFRQGPKAEGTAPDVVEAQAKETTKGWKNAPKTKVVKLEKDLPKHLQDQIEKENVINPKGVWDPRTQSVFLIAENLTGKDDIVSTILHEITGHFGIQKILGDKYLKTMSDMYMGNKEVKERADIKIANGMEKTTAVEEVLAEMAERNTNPSIVQRLVNIIRQALRAIGVQFQGVTNGEVLQLLRDSRRYVIGSEGVINGGNVRLGGVFNADAPIFYSRLAAMVAGAPKQFDNASEEQWRSWIKGNAGKNQVKEEELEYTGVLEFLNFGRDKNEKISRGKLLEFLNEEGVKVEETVYSGVDDKQREELEKELEKIEKTDFPLKRKLQIIRLDIERIKGRFDDLADRIVNNKLMSPGVEEQMIATNDISNDQELLQRVRIYVHGNGFYKKELKEGQGQKLYEILTKLHEEEYSPLRKEEAKVSSEIRNIRDKIDKLRDKLRKDNRRFGSYTMEGYQGGSTNYVELVLRLPLKKPKAEIKKNADGTYALYDEHGDEIIGRILTLESAKKAKEDIGDSPISDYQHGHWPDIANPVVHIRFNEKTDTQGNRVLFVEELQSDWGQAWGLPEGGKLLDLRNSKENAEARNIVGDSDIDFVTNYSYDTDPEMAELFNVDFVYVDTIKGGHELVGYAEYSGKPKTKKEAIRFLMDKKSIPRVEEAPFITEPRSYTALAVKRLLRYAADNGYDKISFISGEESHQRFPRTATGKSTEKGMKAHYDERIPSVVKKVFNELGVSPNSRIEGVNVTKGDKKAAYVQMLMDPSGKEIGPFESYTELESVLYDTYFQLYGDPVLAERVEDPDTQKTMFFQGRKLNGLAVARILNAGYAPEYFYSSLLKQKMPIKIIQKDISKAKPFFTIDITPEGAAKVKQGQAMFRSGEATLRNNPTAPGVTGADAQSIFDGFINTVQNAGILSPARADKVHEFLKNSTTGAFRTAVLSSLPVNALSEVAEKAGLKNAKRFNEIINEHSGYVDKLNRSIEPLVAKAEEWAKFAGKEQVDLFNKVVYDSTTLKVDPENKLNGDVATQAEYDRVLKDYNSMTPEAKTLYKNIRNAYGAMYAEIIKSIEERINTFVEDPDTRAKIKEDILSKLAKRGEINPYFALTRKGNYWLSYNEGGETYVEAFETERERTRNKEELEKGKTADELKLLDAQEFSKISDYKSARAPSGSFVNKILKVLELNRPKNATPAELKKYDEAAEEVMNLYLSTLPETSFAQSFQKRKDTLGYRRDAIEALRDRMYSTSQQLGRMKYTAKLNKLLDDFKEYSRMVGGRAAGDEQQDNKLLNDYIKIFEKHADYIINPKVNKLSSILNSIGFNYLLGFNVSSAVVNLSQVPLIVAPYLAGEHTWGETMREINNAYKLYLTSGIGENVRETEMIGSNGEKIKQRGMPSIDNYSPDSKEGKQYATLIEEAQRQGQMNRSQFYDILEVDGRKNWGSTLNATSGFIFHHGERANRQVTMVAAYNLKLNQLNKKGVTGKEAELQAANYAINISELTNGGISASGAPLIAKNSVGKVLFMFKRYGVSMYYLLFKTARDALKNQDPDVKKAAMGQLAGIYGMAALFAGLQGLPMFGVACMIYNLFADEDEDDMETATRKYVGEGVYKGLINYTTGLDIASRVGLNDLIFRTSPNSNSSTFEQALLETLGGPVYGVGSRLKRGYDFLAQGNLERGVENILPSSISNVLKGFRYGTEGAKTLRGDPMVEDISAFSVGAQMLGFAPAELTRQQAINARQKGVEKFILEKKTKLLQRYNISDRMGDFEAKNEAKEELEELGKKHPGLEITADTFSSSAEAFKQATKETVHGVRYSKKLGKEMLSNAAEYD